MKIFKDEKNRHNFIIFCLVGISLISFYFMLLRIDVVISIFKLIFSIIKPFVVGIILAFLLKSPMKFIEFVLLNKLKLKEQTKHRLAVLLSLLFGLVLLIIFLLLLLPQLFISIRTLVMNFSEYYATLDTIIVKIETMFEIDLSFIFNKLINSLPPIETLTTYAMNALSVFLTNFVSITFNFFNEFIKILVGVIVCTYILLDSKSITFQMKRTLYAFVSNDKADRIVYIANLTDRSFTNFISGKIIDSLIIGILCYIGMSIFKMPFALLISVIVGITNVIPFFGPFIGAIPGAFIVLVSSPMQCIWFLLFILALQQFDGNILGPYILGDSLGLPAIWVMFAILVGGGILGIPGMIVGVPAFAVIYNLCKERIENNLKRKSMLLKDAEKV